MLTYDELEELLLYDELLLELESELEDVKLLGSEELDDDSPSGNAEIANELNGPNDGDDMFSPQTQNR